MSKNIEAINNVVCEYFGNIYSRGSCYEDEKALKNLKLTIELIDHQMLGIIDEYRSTKRAFEGSRIESNRVCKEYMESMIYSLKEALKDD